MKCVPLLKFPAAPEVTLSYKGSFEYVAIRFANRNSAQDDRIPCSEVSMARTS
jgi:hypothetical protein